MSNKWLGYAVSVRCGSPLGCYQGTVAAADGAALTLTKPFRNGFPYPKAAVTLNAADIKSLSIIEAAPGESTSSTEPAAASTHAARKHRQRATVCESLQATSTEHGDGSNRGSGDTRTNNKGNATGIPIPAGRRRGGGGGGLTGSGGRDEAAFGAAAAGAAFMEEFDFERNNALFDKRAIWQTMGKPDLIPSHAYRHDQNVLGSAPPRPPSIEVPLSLRGPWDYVTDSGLRVPSARGGLRKQLWDAIRDHQLLLPSLTLLSRATCDVLVRLSGGNRRLEPRNKHQTPRAVVLTTHGHHHTAHAALITARMLSSHGMHVTVYLEQSACNDAHVVRSDAALWDAELKALQLAGVTILTDCNNLGAADVILVALHAAPAMDRAPPSAGAVWATGQRGAVVTMEPPAHGWSRLTARASVQALLPASLSPSLGQTYLVDVAPPPRLIQSLDAALVYHSPYAACSVLSLHPDNE